MGKELKVLSNMFNLGSKVQVECPDSSWIFWVYVFFLTNTCEELLTYWPHVRLFDSFIIYPVFEDAIRGAVSKIKRFVVLTNDVSHHSKTMEVLEDCGMVVFKTEQALVNRHDPINLAIMDGESFFHHKVGGEWNDTNPLMFFHDDFLVSSFKKLFESGMEHAELAT